jgi:L-fuculose-phosphate aldolase
MLKARQEVAAHGRKMAEAGLTTRSGGNLSVIDRKQKLVAVSPSGRDYFDLKPGGVVLVDLEGRVAEGSGRPSSELPFHLALYRARPEVGAVVHTHSPYAATLACLGWELPPAHYLVGFAGRKVPLAPYRAPGSRELARVVVAAMEGCNAVLLANHGLVTVGSSLALAFTAAESLELAARVYYQARAVGKPKVLGKKQMDELLPHFARYGRG